MLFFDVIMNCSLFKFPQVDARHALRLEFVELWKAKVMSKSRVAFFFHRHLAPSAISVRSRMENAAQAPSEISPLVARNEEEVQRELQAATVALATAERQRVVERANARAPPKPHKRHKDWLSWAPQKSVSHLTRKTKPYDARNRYSYVCRSEWLSGGVDTSVPESTVRSWLRRGRKAEKEHIEAASSDASFIRSQESLTNSADEDAVMELTKPKRPWRNPKILEFQKLLLLEWKAKYTEATCAKLATMLVYHMREVTTPSIDELFVSESSVRRILKGAGYVWKMARPSRAVIFTPNTARASVRYANAFNRLMAKSGAAEYADRTTYADETTFSVQQATSFSIMKCKFAKKIQLQFQNALIREVFQSVHFDHGQL